MRASILLTALGLGGLAAAAAGQASAPGRSTRIDLSAGPALGLGGTYFARSGLAVIAGVATVVPVGASGGVVLAGGLSLSGNPNAGDDDCQLQFGGTRCVGRFPLFVGVAPEIGWRFGRGRRVAVDFRGGAGPYWSTIGGGADLGAHVRLLVALRIGSDLALQAGLRGIAYPNVDGRPLSSGSVLFGIEWAPWSPQ